MIPSKIFQVRSGDVWFQEGRCSTPHNVSHRVEKGRSPRAKSTATSGRLKGSWKNRRFLEGIGRIGNPKLSSTLRHQDTHPQSGWRTKCPFEWSCTLRLNLGDLSPPEIVKLGPLEPTGLSQLMVRWCVFTSWNHLRSEWPWISKLKAKQRPSKNMWIDTGSVHVGPSYA